MVRALASGLLVSVVSLLAASGRALAGHVLVVDAGGSGSFTDIQPAVNAAVDGDAILVKSGSYAGIYIGDKTLSIVADTGAVVVVQGQVSVNYLSANRSVLVAGLQIGSVNSSAVWIRYSPGGVRLHDCTIVGADNASATCSDGWRGVEIESSTNVALTLCSLHGGRGGSASGCWQVGPGAEALYAHASSVALHECVLQGGPGGAGVFMGAGWTQSSQGGNGGAGCSLQDGFVFASGATIRAGDGGQGGPGAGTCLGTAHGCGGTGGDAVVVNGAAPPDPIVVLLGTGLVRGSGGASGSPNLCFGPPCPGPDGVQIRAPAGAVSQIPGPSRELTASSVARENTVVPLTFHGVPGDHVWLYFARRPTFSYNAPFHGVNLTPVPPLARLIGFGTIPASGTLNTHIVLPDYGVDSKTHFMQALFRDPANDRFLGSPLTLVELDSAF